MPNQIHAKIISLGDTEVGKSCLIKKYCEGKFVPDYITTIGIDYGVKKVTMGNGDVLAVNIFDMSGDNDYKLIRQDYIRDAIGVLLIYDVSIRSTFNNLSKWECEAISIGLDLSNIIVILIANKLDIKSKREVSTKEGKEYAKLKGYQYYETSAKTGSGVNDAFVNLLDSLHCKVLEVRSKFCY